LCIKCMKLIVNIFLRRCIIFGGCLRFW